jgi:hypothetical protein
MMLVTVHTTKLDGLSIDTKHAMNQLGNAKANLLGYVNTGDGKNKSV